MPTFTAVFSESRRKWLARALTVVAAVAAIGAFPVCVYAMVMRSNLFAEAHYFIRESGSFMLKGGFGWSAFLTVPIFFVCLCISFVCWYNAKESRRMDISLFDGIMTILMWATLILWGCCGYTVVAMLLSSFEFSGVVEKGLLRSMMNYDKIATPDPKYPRDKQMLDYLHMSHRCCGVGGWQSFQTESTHLNEISRALVKQNSFDTSFQCSNDKWCYVPFSCCRQTIAFCTNQYFDLYLEHPSRSRTLYDDGCDEKLNAIFQPIFEILGYIYVGYFILFYILFIGCRFFHTSTMLSMKHSIPLTPGYVFPFGYESVDELMAIFLQHETNVLHTRTLESGGSVGTDKDAYGGFQQNENGDTAGDFQDLPEMGGCKRPKAGRGKTGAKGRTGRRAGRMGRMGGFRR